MATTPCSAQPRQAGAFVAGNSPLVDGRSGAVQSAVPGANVREAARTRRALQASRFALVADHDLSARFLKPLRSTAGQRPRATGRAAWTPQPPKLLEHQTRNLRAWQKSGWTVWFRGSSNATAWSGIFRQSDRPVLRFTPLRLGPELRLEIVNADHLRRRLAARTIIDRKWATFAQSLTAKSPSKGRCWRAVAIALVDVCARRSTLAETCQQLCTSRSRWRPRARRDQIIQIDELALRERYRQSSDDWCRLRPGGASTPFYSTTSGVRNETQSTPISSLGLRRHLDAVAEWFA